jgi:uncharacterized SAM-binding protein YcdF (DUF218 family)
MRKRVLFRVIMLILAVGGFVLLQPPILGMVWPRLLMVNVPLEKADCLILLGGEQDARPVVTARLYASGVAPLIFITGSGDNSANKRALLDRGIPSSAIKVEPLARSTLMNARLLRPMLEAEGIRSALIITSPFHTRRALAVFRHEIPSVRFGIVDARREYWATRQGIKGFNASVIAEFGKTAYYWFVHGIAPFTYSLESPAVGQIRASGVNCLATPSPKSL